MSVVSETAGRAKLLVGVVTVVVSGKGSGGVRCFKIKCTFYLSFILLVAMVLATDL